MRAAAKRSRASARARRPTSSSWYGTSTRYLAAGESSCTDGAGMSDPAARWSATASSAMRDASPWCDSEASLRSQMACVMAASSLVIEPRRCPSMAGVSSSESTSSTTSRRVSSDQRLGPRRARMESVFIGVLHGRRGSQSRRAMFLFLQFSFAWSLEARLEGPTNMQSDGPASPIILSSASRPCAFPAQGAVIDFSH